MPRFVLFIQDNLLLPLLIIASAYTTGIMLVDGWVGNIENPDTWGLFHGLGVPIFFAAGAAIGGLGVRCSFKAASCLVQKQWGRFFFMILGILLTSGIEFWASLSQRAEHLQAGRADKAVLSAFDINSPAISVTATLIALVVPAVSLFWGFAADDPAPKPVEDPEVLRRRLENERIIAEHKADMMVVRAKGLRKAVAGARGKVLPIETPETDPSLPTPEGDKDETEIEEKPDDSPIKLRALPRGVMDKAALIAWAKKELNRDLTDDQAIEVVKSTKGMSRLESMHGRPYVAPKRAVTTLARRMYPPVPVRAITAQRSHESDDNPPQEAMQ